MTLIRMAVTLRWDGWSAHREWERVCDLQRGANIEAQQLPSDEVRCALLAVLHKFEDDVALELHRPQPAVLCLRHIDVSNCIQP